MSKCLVIKNANFSTNKLATVVFNNVPCTAVSFNSATLTVPLSGETTMTYTVTPSNTSDAKVWSSSNTSVLTVSDGVITPHALGTSVVTLTCGSYSATCTVTVDAIENPFLALATYASKSYGNDTYAHLSEASRITCCDLLENSEFTNKLHIYNKRDTFSHGDVTAIKIPSGVSAIHVSATGLYSTSPVSVVFVDANSPMTIDSIACLKEILKHDCTVIKASGDNSVDESVSVPQGANGYFVCIRLASATELNSVASEQDMKTVYNSKNIVIRYEMASA